MDLAKHITSFLKKHVPDYPSSAFLIAVSGGVDSMVLLHALQRLDLNISVAHVNYQLRGKDSDLDAFLVEEYCNANGINHYELLAEINKTQGIQEEARTIRYEWFSDLRATHTLDFTITAHHLDDQAETILQKLSRGTGLAGAAGIKPVNEKKLRPLLGVNKAEIQAYAKLNKVPFRTDTSNLKNTYTRNKIRNTILPELESVNLNARNHIAGFSHIASQAESLAKAEAKRTWDSNSINSKYGTHLNLSSWINADYAPLVLHYILADLQIAGSYSSEIFKLCFSDSGKHITTDKFIIWKDRAELFFEIKKEKNSLFESVLTSEGIYSLPDGEIELTLETYKKPLEFSDDLIYLPADTLTWPLKIRTWKPGDSFKPFGMKGSKKVSDLLIQKKISASKKEKTLVLEHLSKIIWVVGIRSSEETRVSSEHKKVLKILITAYK